MLILGDALHIPLANESVQCVVTSPPYWGLRDYGVDGQLGLEKTPEEYVAKMVEAFREVRRVLRNDGTVWLNLGDSYAGSWGNYGGQNRGNGSQREIVTGSQAPNPAYDGLERWRPPTTNAPGLKPKDLVGIPWRVAFALQAEGWWLRQDIIWAKPNPMPESVTDRCTKSHEYVFLLTKSASYFYDAEAVKESWTSGRDDMRKHGIRTASAYIQQGAMMNNSDAGEREVERNQHDYQGGRNRRSVWNIPTQPYKGAHFATFPEKLVEPCVLAGTSEKGCCEKCGAPWGRVVERGLTAHDGQTDSAYAKSSTANRLALLRQAARERGEEYSNAAKTVGWKPTCSCGADTKPCVVLDPFCGSGTVGVVAARHNRQFIGLELNPKYIELAKKRQRNIQPYLMEVPC